MDAMDSANAKSVLDCLGEDPDQDPGDAISFKSPVDGDSKLEDAADHDHEPRVSKVRSAGISIRYHAPISWLGCASLRRAGCARNDSQGVPEHLGRPWVLASCHHGNRIQTLISSCDFRFFVHARE